MNFIFHFNPATCYAFLNTSINHQSSHPWNSVPLSSLCIYVRHNHMISWIIRFNKLVTYFFEENWTRLASPFINKSLGNFTIMINIKKHNQWATKIIINIQQYDDQQYNGFHKSNFPQHCRNTKNPAKHNISSIDHICTNIT